MQKLTSTQLNYLIWRYLQESGYSEAATKLQRDWNQPDPQSLPFASHIKTHALVALVQRGLLYYDIQASLDENGQLGTAPPAISFFGESVQDEEETTSPSPRQGLSPLEIPKKRKSKRTNGASYEINGSVDRMDIDGEDQSPSTKTNRIQTTTTTTATTRTANSPLANENGDVEMTIEDRPILTITNGQSVGVQSHKPEELGPATTFLHLAADASANSALAPAPLADDFSEPIHVTQALWNPHDPSVLATTGETLSRVYEVQSSENNKPLQTKCHELLEEGKQSTVTAACWSPDGNYFAVAARTFGQDMSEEVKIYSKNGLLVDELSSNHDMVLALRWSPNSNQLLGIATIDDKASITIWCLGGTEFPPFTANALLLDAAWTSEDVFSTCGEDGITEFKLVEGVIKMQTVLTEKGYEQVSWRKMGFSGPYFTGESDKKNPRLSRLVSIADEKPYIWVSNLASSRIYNETSSSPLTTFALSWNQSPTPDAPILLATASTTASICLYDLRPFPNDLTLIHTLNLGPSSSALALSFSPDSTLLAAGCYDHVSVWKTASYAGILPVAEWRPEDKENWASAEGEGEEDDHCLEWDAQGEKIAFGVGQQIALIEYHRR
ncbi:MAG: hypothetical protein M1834_003095 [Cirrosporium novae-zelandiae]|nr:MAG: hypothetical protein M1834_003095 [Cirrosporium novae-zelandiae]